MTDRTPTRSPRRARITVVEDSPTQALRTRLALEKASFEVEVCSTGTLALERITQRPPDLVLLDIHLPDLDGLEVARRLKTDPLLGAIPIIFLTGSYLEIKDVIAGLEGGADNYLRKPIEDSELVARIRASLRIRQTHIEFSRLARQMLTVNQVGQRLAGILELDSLLESVARMIHTDFAYPHVYVFLIDAQTGQLALRATASATANVNVGEFDPLRPEEPGLITATMRDERSLLVNDVESDARYVRHPTMPAIRAELTAPIRSHGTVVGVLDVQSEQPEAFDERDRLVLETLADLVGVAVHNSHLYQIMEHAATRDALTDLFNRRAFMSFLEAEFARCGRYQHPLALIAVDVDRFKSINDRFGHPVGDQVLIAVAKCCCEITRTVDVVGRLGGDEFMLLLPETDLDGARDVARRLHQVVSAARIPTEGGETARTSLSLGVVSWPGTPAETVSELLKAADQALYRAKAAGRDQASV